MSDEWRNDAACKGKPTEWWYPAKGGSPWAQKARDICASCPVSAECSTFARYNAERYGIWGGEGAYNVRRRDFATGQAVRVVACRNCDHRFTVLGTKRTAFCSDECRSIQARIVHNRSYIRNEIPERATACDRCGDPVRDSSVNGYCGWECERMDRRARWARLDNEVAS
jgi:hypothetical protein